VTRPRLLRTAVAVAVVLAWVNGLAARWLFVDFTLSGSSGPGRDDYLAGSGACTGAALLLAAAVAALVGVRRRLGLPVGLAVTPALGALTMAALAVTAWDRSRGLPDEPGGAPFAGGVGTALVWPGSWPLWIVLVVLLVLAWRRSPGRS
jgi:hypothetical protein